MVFFLDLIAFDRFLSGLDRVEPILSYFKLILSENKLVRLGFTEFYRVFLGSLSTVRVCTSSGHRVVAILLSSFRSWSSGHVFDGTDAVGGVVWGHRRRGRHDVGGARRGVQPDVGLGARRLGRAGGAQRPDPQVPARVDQSRRRRRRARAALRVRPPQGLCRRQQDQSAARSGARQLLGPRPGRLAARLQRERLHQLHLLLHPGLFSLFFFLLDLI